jgi:acid phosphatase
MNLKNKLFKYINLKLLSLILLLSVICGCGRQRPVNLTIAKERVEEYHEKGLYDKDLNRIVDRAIRYFARISATNNATIIFDIDETLLTAYLDEKSISFGYIPKLFHEWVLEADTPAIPQTKRLYSYLIDRGFKIVLLTGRKYNEYDATIKNLKDQGITQFDKLIVRSKEEKDLSAQEYKTARREQLTKQGYDIVGAVGDQWSDLKGKYSGHRVKVPNYRYMIR